MYLYNICIIYKIMNYLRKKYLYKFKCITVKNNDNFDQ